MLRDEVAKYTELSGNDGEHTSIGIIGAYLDGYNKGLAIHSVENKGEWIPMYDRWGDIVTTVCGYECSKCGEWNADNDNFCPNCGADMRGD